MFSNSNHDLVNISRLSGKFSASELEELDAHINEDKKLDEIRKLLTEQLENAKKRINQQGWTTINSTQKSELLFDIQEILYEMQLVEHAAKTPILHIAKIIFSANPSRCICRETSPAKSKPPKRRRNELGGLGSVGSSIGSNDEVRSVFGIAKRNPIRDVDISKQAHNLSEEQRNNSDEWTHNQTSAPNSRKSSIRTTIKQPYQRKSLLVSRTPSGKFQCDRTPLSPSNEVLQDFLVSKGIQKRNKDSTTTNEDFLQNDNYDCLAELEQALPISYQDCPSSPYRNIDERFPSTSTASLLCGSPSWNGGSSEASINGAIEFSPLSTRAAKKQRNWGKGGDTINNDGVMGGKSPRKRYIETDTQMDGEVHRPTASADEPTYCLCEQVSFGDMICCDYELCSVEWFHFSCVNLKSKPKQGKRWFCPLCRHNDKPGSLKPELQQKLDQIHKLQRQ
uniref:PHD-type domain-containing protein n=1 Tax=Meloidogyne javanica TaxID=6303 RepID=A0A915MTS3_MELJA